MEVKTIILDGILVKDPINGWSIYYDMEGDTYQVPLYKGPLALPEGVTLNDILQSGRKVKFYLVIEDKISYAKLEGNWNKVLFCGLYDNGGGPKSEETKLKIGLGIEDKISYAKLDTTEKKVDHITESVREDLKRRSEIGIKKYGTTLQENNHQNMLQHAYEEALDLAQYLKKEITTLNTIQNLITQYSDDAELGKIVRAKYQGPLPF